MVAVLDMHPPHPIYSLVQPNDFYSFICVLNPTGASNDGSPHIRRIVLCSEDYFPLSAIQEASVRLSDVLHSFFILFIYSNYHTKLFVCKVVLS